MMLRLAALSLLLSASAMAEEHEAAVIVLKDHVRIDRVDVHLADIADVRTDDAALRDRLAKVSVALIPRTGASRTIRRSDVQALLARLDNAPAVLVQGALRTEVRLRTADYPAARVIDAAREHLVRHLRERYPSLTTIDARAVDQAADLRAPAGDLAVVPRPIRGDALSKRVCVWVDLRLNGGVYRSIPVWLNVAAYAPAVVAKRAIKPRENVEAGDVALEERDVAGLNPTLLARLDDIAGRRARTFIAAGAVVQTKNLEPSPQVLADGLVDVRVTAGSVVIETQAIAEQDGYVGDYVKVRNPKTAATFSARVVGENAVIVTQR